MSSPQKVLADKDANAAMRSPNAKTDGNKPKSLEYHRAVLEQRRRDGKYVSTTTQSVIAPLSSLRKTAVATSVHEVLPKDSVEELRKTWKGKSSGDDIISRPKAGVAGEDDSVCTSKDRMVVSTSADGDVEKGNDSNATTIPIDKLVKRGDGSPIVESLHQMTLVDSFHGEATTSEAQAAQVQNTQDTFANPMHPRVLASRMQTSYISPSDQLMSPATAKLAAFKNKHMGQSSKPKTLFARTLSNSAASQSPEPMFGDIQKKPSSQ